MIYILEEIRYNAILIKELQCSLEDIKINSNNILSYCKKINNLLNYSS